MNPGPIEMQNLHDHLLAAEERVADELARSQRNWLLFVRHLCEEENRLVCRRWLSRQMDRGAGVDEVAVDCRFAGEGISSSKCAL